MSSTFAQRVINYNHQLQFKVKLPVGFETINPFAHNPETIRVMEAFYQYFYNDNEPRRLIIGINPSRHGAAVTGVPFTDTKRLEQVCGIKMKTVHTHEVSSVFMYDMIAQYGGAKLFYKNFYINSPFPLAIISNKKNPNKWLNANYYDDPTLFKDLETYMTETLQKHISMGIDTSHAFVLGKKNASYIAMLNRKASLFKKLSVLEHPRYIQQYFSKEKDRFILKYLQTLN